MSVLVDTSVWVDHFRRGNDGLIELVRMDSAMTHPMILAELACGTPPAPRAQTLGDIALLRPVIQASMGELMDFVERDKLYGLGCGLVDMALLASTLLTPGARLWTLDKRLANLTARFGVGYQAHWH